MPSRDGLPVEQKLPSLRCFLSCQRSHRLAVDGRRPHDEDECGKQRLRSRHGGNYLTSAGRPGWPRRREVTKKIILVFWCFRGDQLWQPEQARRVFPGHSVQVRVAEPLGPERQDESGESVWRQGVTFLTKI